MSLSAHLVVAVANASSKFQGGSKNNEMDEQVKLTIQIWMIAS